MISMVLVPVAGSQDDPTLHFDMGTLAGLAFTEVQISMKQP